MDLIFAAIVTALLISTGHWFPWRVVLGKPLPPLVAYTYGVSAILCGILVWRGLTGDWQTVIGVAAICAAAGGMTALAYGIDRIARALHHERIAESVIDAGER